MKLVVNADDFGIDENRTTAILECFRLGAISRTTAMVNMSYFMTAVEVIKSMGLVDRMGLHLNLTEGVPLTARMRECRVFSDGGGCFTGDFHRCGKMRLWLPAGTEVILRDELRAQIEKFLASGAVLLHIDSHHHVHTDYSVARVLLPLLREYGFKSIRKSRNLCVGVSFPKRIYKALFNRYVTRGMLSTDWFGRFEDFQQCLANVRADDSVEVMVHPMYGAPEQLDLAAPLTDSGWRMVEELAFYRESEIEVAHD